MRWLIIFFYLLPGMLFATEGIGQYAEGLMEPVSILSEFINSAAIIMGLCLLFAAILKYKQHKINPLYAPMGTVIWLLILGIVLLCLPLLYYKLSTSPIS